MISSSSSSTGSSVESAIYFIKNTLIFQENSIGESQIERDYILSQFLKAGKINSYELEGYLEIDGEKIIRCLGFTCDTAKGYFIG